MASPCTNDPNEVISAVVGIQSAEEDFERELDDASSAAVENADKFDSFVNGTDTQTVQLGEGSPTPTIRNTVRQMLSGAAALDSADVSGKSATANGGAEMRTLAERFEDIINAKDFGAKGDGITDDTAAFAALEDAVSGRFVNLCGGSYAVDEKPEGNLYYNGFFVVDGMQSEALNCMLHVGCGAVAGMGATPPNFVISGEKPAGFNSGLHNGVVSLGTGNLRSLDAAKRAGSLIAIGEGVMSEGHPSNFNIGIGAFALHSIDGTYSTTGDRNVAIGSLSLFGLTTGRCNGGFGRDTGQCITSGSYNVCVGYGAISGSAPVGLSGAIECQNELTGSYNTVVGCSSARFISSSSSNNSVLGHQALDSARNANNNCVVGKQAMRDTQANTSVNGKQIIYKSINGTYSQTGSSLTINAPGHNAVAGRLVNLSFQSGQLFDVVGTDTQWLQVNSVIDSSSFTILVSTERTASGDCATIAFEQAADSSELAEANVAVGIMAGLRVHSAENSCIIGPYAGQMASASSGNSMTGSNCIGMFTAGEATSLSFADLFGYSAARFAASVSNSCVVGRASGNAGAISESVVMGSFAANCSNAVAIKDSVCIGSQSMRGATGSEVKNAVVVGSKAGQRTTKLDNSVLIGSFAGDRAADLSQCTVLGSWAMYHVSATTSINKSTALGFNSQVSGSNQIQLGASTETTYAYGAVQDRSDLRDKADVRDSILGSDFIMGLRPVDFRWDYRDSYTDIVEDGVDEEGNPQFKIVEREKDGSRKRSRFHHGFIAQEVKALMDEQGIDFGGYQDHKINGGKDVLTIGYEELIAPIVKTLQEFNNRLKALEA